MGEFDIRVAILEPDQERGGKLAAVLGALGVASQAYENPAQILPSPDNLCLAFAPDAEDPPTDELLASCAAREVGVILYSQDPARTRMAERLLRGAIGYVAWPPDAAELRAALDIAQQFGRKRLRRLAAESGARQMLATLTRREREVLALMTAGRTNQEMGAAMGISGRTVENHRAQILEKLGGTTISAIRSAVYAGLDLDHPSSG